MGLSLDQWIDVLSASVGFGGVAWTIWHGQRQNQLRATVDLVIEQKRNVELAAARQVFAKARSLDNLGKWASKENAGTEEAKAIMLILNDYEFIASAMRDRAFNLCLYKRMKYSTVIRDWESLQAFVHEKRQEVRHPTLFQEFEWMAKRFKKKPLKQDND